MANSPMSKKKIAVILFNLGGPDSLKAVKPFLFNLFYDPAIFALKNPLRWFVAKTISHKRTKFAQDIYDQVGGKSPLLEQTKAQAKALENKLNEDNDKEYSCFISMRYWHPRSVETAKKVKEFNPDHIVLLPLYPHYSITTTGSSLIDWVKSSKKINLDAPYSVIKDYPVTAGYIDAHIDLIQKAQEKIDDLANYRILYSAHGLPEKTIEAGDPYQDQIEQNCLAIQKRLGHPDHIISYQSRVGPMKWIGPYTNDEITRAGKEGKSLIIVPISFVSEHAETLVELDIEYAKLAKEVGVKNYIRIATISCHEAYITALSDLTQNILQDKLND